MGYGFIFSFRRRQDVELRGNLGNCFFLFSLYLAGCCCCCWTQLISYSNGVICQKRTVRNKVALHNVWSGQFVSSLFHSLLFMVCFCTTWYFGRKQKIFQSLAADGWMGKQQEKEFIFPQNHHATTITLNIYFIIFTFSAHDVNLFGLFCFVFTNRKIVLSLK